MRANANDALIEVSSQQAHVLVFIHARTEQKQIFFKTDQHQSISAHWSSRHMQIFRKFYSLSEWLN